MRWLQHVPIYLGLFCILEVVLDSNHGLVEWLSPDVATKGNVGHGPTKEDLALMNDENTNYNYTQLPRSPTIIAREEDTPEPEGAVEDPAEEIAKPATKEKETPATLLVTGPPKEPEGTAAADAEVPVQQGQGQADEAGTQEITKGREAKERQKAAAVAVQHVLADESRPHPHHQAPPYNFYKPTGSETWFHLHCADEGMSNWKISLAQFISVARGAGAVIVEPCVARGMLRNCNASDPGTYTGGVPRQALPEGMVPLREVFEMQTFLDYYPKIVPYDEFLRYTNYGTSIANVEKICMSRWLANAGPQHICRANNISNYMMGAHIEPIDRMFSATKERNEHAVVEIYNLWRWGIASYKPGCNDKRCRQFPVAIDANWKDFEQQFSFPKHQIQNVKEMLQQLLPDTTLMADGNINFGALQWRPEGQTIPYMECAKALVKARDVLAAQHNIPKENFLLMTPLSERKDLVWDGVAFDARNHTNTVIEALQYLRANSIQRLEDVHSVNDGSLPAVWDFVAASLATAYSTCHRCRGSFCHHCSYSGHSATFSMSNREKYRHDAGLQWENTSRSCWPEW
jgi:hypothetical protein